METDFEELNKIIQEVFNKTHRDKFTFLTGAGISAESGIPTYRGSDGIWVKGTKYHKPEEFGTFEYFINHQEEVWQYTLFTKKMMEQAKPNNSHYTLMKIENLLNDRFHLITQNVDNLHNRAGTKRIFEIHGNFREVKCSHCKEISVIPDNIAGKNINEELRDDEIKSLHCLKCRHWLRPNVLWFDENYDEKTHKKDSALKVAKNSGVLFIIGTSGATTLPIEIAQQTLRYGGYVYLIDLNIDDNQFTNLLKDKYRARFIQGESSKILPILQKMVENCIIT